MIAPTLYTERLMLRAPKLADFDGLYGFVSSDRAKYSGGAVTDKQQVWSALTGMAGQWALRGHGPFVWETHDGRTIGHGGAYTLPNHTAPELGWWIWRDEDEGQGYAAEAMKTVLHWACSIAGLQNLWAAVELENARSFALIERLNGQAQTGPAPDGDEIPWFRFDANFSDEGVA